MSEGGQGQERPGDYIRRLREARGMSRADLQRELGVAYTTVKQWEEKGAVPERRLTALLIERLKLTPEEEQGLRLAVDQATPSSGSRASHHAASSPRTLSPAPVRKMSDEQRREAMSEALDKALDTKVHKVMDAIRVLDALVDGGEGFLALTDPSVAARAWLDGAVMLREREIAVTAGNLAAVLPEVIASRAKEPQGE